MELHSEYYNTTLSVSDDQLETILQAYNKWCEKNHCKPECENIEEMKESGSVFDHVLYHAEIEIREDRSPDYKNIDDLFFTSYDHDEPHTEIRTVRHDDINDAPSVCVRMDPEQMLFHTDKDGFYAYMQSEFEQNGEIEGLEEISDVEMEAEDVKKGQVILRVWATEYTINVDLDSEFKFDSDEDAEDNDFPSPRP